MKKNNMSIYKKFLDKEDFKAGRHFLPEVRYHRYLVLLSRRDNGVPSVDELKAYYDQIYVKSTPLERETVVPCPVCTQLIAEAINAGIDPFKVHDDVAERLRGFGINYRAYREPERGRICGA
jgi:hypothetical protein